MVFPGCNSSEMTTYEVWNLTNNIDVCVCVND